MSADYTAAITRHVATLMSADYVDKPMSSDIGILLLVWPPGACDSII